MDDDDDAVHRDDEADFDEGADSIRPSDQREPVIQVETWTGLRKAWSMSSSATPCFRALSATTGST